LACSQTIDVTSAPDANSFWNPASSASCPVAVQNRFENVPEFGSYQLAIVSASPLLYAVIQAATSLLQSSFVSTA
jgi:hypothetical protein